jgi:predicted metallo-beta-lactamase superfamily hydrolase
MKNLKNQMEVISVKKITESQTNAAISVISSAFNVTNKKKLEKEKLEEVKLKLESDQVKYNGAALINKIASHLHDLNWADNHLGGYGKTVINSTTDYLHGQGKSLINFVDSNIGDAKSTANFASDYITTPLVNHGKNITLGVTSAAMSYYGHSKMPLANFTISVLEKSANNPDGYVHQTYESVIGKIPNDFKEAVKKHVTDEVLDGIKEHGGGVVQGAVSGGVMCKDYSKSVSAVCVVIHAGVSFVGKGAESVANLFAEKETAKNVGVSVDIAVKTVFDIYTTYIDLYNPFSWGYKATSLGIDLVSAAHDVDNAIELSKDSGATQYVSDSMSNTYNSLSEYLSQCYNWDGCKFWE